MPADKNVEVPEVQEEKNLHYFMKKPADDDVIEIPGLDTFKDSKGKPIPIRFKKVTTKYANELRTKLTSRSPIKDGKGRVMVDTNGRVAMKIEFDETLYVNCMVSDHLVFPNLKDSQLMQSYKCASIYDMPELVFSQLNDYNYITEQLMKISKITLDDKEIEEAKNSSKRTI